MFPGGKGGRCLGLALFVILLKITLNVGQAVTQLFEALRYKPEGRGFDS